MLSTLDKCGDNDAPFATFVAKIFIALDIAVLNDIFSKIFYQLEFVNNGTKKHTKILLKFNLKFGFIFELNVL